MIDAHQHFWQFDPDRDVWMDVQTMATIRRDFEPPDLLKIVRAHGIKHTIAVQADQSIKETRYLLNLASKYDFIAGVVGWIDLLDPDLSENIPSKLENPKLLGFRHILQAEDPSYILNGRFIHGVQTIGNAGFTYDILVYARQLPEVVTFVRECPNQKMILDHLGKPDIKAGNLHPWKENIGKIAQSEHVYCKVSGMITEADWSSWTYEKLKPFLDVVFQTFGVNRCVFGSDWPVCTLAGSYAQVLRIVSRYLDENYPKAHEKVFWKNAVEFYGLNLKQ